VRVQDSLTDVHMHMRAQAPLDWSWFFSIAGDATRGIDVLHRCVMCAVWWACERVTK
jgi:hypothetical protein